MTVKNVAAASIVTGLVLVSSVAVWNTPKMRAKRMTRRAGRTMDALGTMLHSMAVMTK